VRNTFERAGCVCCFVLLTRGWGRLETRPPVALGSSPALFAFTMSWFVLLNRYWGGERYGQGFQRERAKGDTPRVQGVPIRDCATGCTNRGQSWSMMSAIDVTAKIFFERLYLVIGLRKIAPWVNCPYARTAPTVHSTTISRFPYNFFPRMAPHFLGHHDSPSNLEKSRYPRHTHDPRVTLVRSHAFYFEGTELCVGPDPYRKGSITGN